MVFAILCAAIFASAVWVIIDDWRLASFKRETEEVNKRLDKYLNDHKPKE